MRKGINMPENETLTFTKEELQKKIDNSLAEQLAKMQVEMEENYKSKLNIAMKSERERYERDLKKAGLSEAEKLKAETEEAIKNLQDENARLKQYERKTKVDSLFTKNQIPSILRNDARLASAEDKDLDKVTLEIKKEWDEYSKSSPSTAIVHNSNQNNNGSYTAEQLAELAEKNPAEYRRIRQGK